MIYILFDTFAQTYTGYFLATFLIAMHYMDVKKFVPALLFLFVISGSIMTTVTVFIFYAIDKVIFSYLNYTLIFALSIFTLFFVIIREVDSSYFINLLLVIIFYLHQYNKLGGLHGVKKENQELDY